MGALAKIGSANSSQETSGERLRRIESLETLGRLVGGVAHDFNNLLTGIVLCSDLLLSGLSKESHLRRYAEEIRAAGGQGARLVRQLMDVAAPHAVAVHYVSVNHVIEKMRTLVDRLIGENVQLTTELASHVALVKMDPAQIQQIVLNLVLNARDAMPDGGRITISTRESPRVAQEDPGVCEFIELEIRDSGCGMDAATRARLFEPFFTTKKPGEGTGLGLFTVVNIVQQQKGTVEIQSVPGQGTTVIVRLPGIPADLQETTKSDATCGFEHSETTRR
jgi:two-component system, cell cycle sensor histidine kinase and response regulator CckA